MLCSACRHIKIFKKAKSYKKYVEKDVFLIYNNLNVTILVTSNNEGITDYFRECKKHLNHYAAVTTSEFLDSDEIRDLAFNYMVKLCEKKLSGIGSPLKKRKKK